MMQYARVALSAGPAKFCHNLIRTRCNTNIVLNALLLHIPFNFRCIYTSSRHNNK